MAEPEPILVADDDRTIRRNLVRLLQAEGYRTLEAADGTAGAGLDPRRGPRRRSCST